MKSTHAFILRPVNGDGGLASSTAKAALDDATLPALVRCAVALDAAEPVLTLDREFVDETGADLLNAGRAISVLLACDVLALATLRADALVVVRARADGAFSRALWPPALATRAAPLSQSIPIDDDDARAEALALALSSLRLLPEEVLPHVKSALTLDVTLPLSTFFARQRGEILAHQAQTPRHAQARVDDAPALTSARHVETDVLHPFTTTFNLSGARGPVRLELAFDGPLVIDVVRLVGDDAEEVATVASDGAVFFSGNVLSRAGRARVVVEGLARSPGPAALMLRCGAARAHTDLVVRPPPRPLAGVDVSSTPGRAPFLIARQGGAGIVLATLTVDDEGEFALTRLLSLARGRALTLVAPGEAARPFDDENVAVLVERVLRGRRLEARLREDARTRAGLVVARTVSVAHAPGETIVVAAIGDDGDSPEATHRSPLAIAELVDVARTGGVVQALAASWAWDPFCAPFTTPYEAALGVRGAALSTTSDARTRLRGVGTHLFAQAGPLAAALVDAGATSVDDGALLLTPEGEIAALERRLSAELRGFER